ncbi:MAG: diguanylate cyclase [Eubacteriales bacterium]|nr:diguanylate cyclase [Eubacteriales bacterium]
MEQKSRILIVDDTEINRSLLADMLSADYEILEAADGVEAVALLSAQHGSISLVLLDVVMPNMGGFEVLEIMGRSGWLHNTPVITISAETSSSYIDHAYDLGATDYISRPFDEKTVQRRVHNTIMLYTKQKSLERMVTEQIVEKERSSFIMVEVLSNIVEFRNGESGLHVLHIRAVTDLLLRRLAEKTDRYNLSPAQIMLITNASALHDIGKISIPEEILNKPGRLTAAEFEVMKTHAAIGAQILENAPGAASEPLLLLARDICRWHHERYDGRGYPDGLAGEQIPIAAQVVALADVYDALTNERIYKPAYTHEQALRMIFAGECGAFNPLLLDCLTDVGDRISKQTAARTYGGLSSVELGNIASELMHDNELHASTRTLTLLDQERTKYHFFASMSQEVQFEYNVHADLLEFSEWGAKHLDIPELLPHPLHSDELHQVFVDGDDARFFALLQQTTPDAPTVSDTFCLRVQGMPRWFKLVARTLWDGEDDSAYATAIGKFVDIHEERLELAHLKQQAALDPLTTLYNRVAARAAIEDKISVPGSRRYAMMLFDVDYFKNANDRFGHLFGDEVLQYVAQRMRTNIRQGDIAARVGGDEFLIFAEYTNNLEAQISRIFRALTVRFHEFPISLSMGVSLCPHDGADYETLFHCADQALYAAKRGGRGRHVLYAPSIQGFLSVLSPMDN